MCQHINIELQMTTYLYFTSNAIIFQYQNKNHIWWKSINLQEKMEKKN